MSWNPRFVAAHASSRGRFCVAVTELEYDEPFTAVIEYDDRFPQPWSRTDIEREITAVSVPDGLDSQPDRFTLLSNEGDFYLTGLNGRREKIPGAGIQSPDASGASDYALHRFDGHRLTPFRPKLDPTVNEGVPTPLKVQAVDDVMFYFDYEQGVSRWDGADWRQIPIPPTLLARNFTGFP